MAIAAVAARLKSVVWKEQSLNWIRLLAGSALGRVFLGWNYITLLVWCCLNVTLVWAVCPQLLFVNYDNVGECIGVISQQLDYDDPDELHKFTILLKIPKSGPPPNYKKWYRSFIPAVKWYTLPHKRPRLVQSKKPDDYHGWFQAMLTPRQVLDLKKLPDFSDFYSGDDDDFKDD